MDDRIQRARQELEDESEDTKPKGRRVRSRHLDVDGGEEERV